MSYHKKILDVGQFIYNKNINNKFYFVIASFNQILKYLINVINFS